MRLMLLCLVACLYCYSVCPAKNFYDPKVLPADARPAVYVPMLKGKRVGLIINQTSVVNGVSLLDMLLSEKVLVKKIFVPEHGFRGTEDAGAELGNSVDSATGIPVVSIYGKHRKPTKEDMADVDVLVYDLQDVGVRFYTYIATLQYCMEACAENHKQMLVLDRPDPNGFYVDGPLMEKEHASFLGLQPIPVVYGMTAGEYAQMLKGEKWFNKADELDLKVVKCISYTHDKKFRLVVSPSPNLKSMAAILAYPSTCVFEGTRLSLGRGTDMPFLVYGCPEFEGKFDYSFTPHSMIGAKEPPLMNKKCYGELVGTTEEQILGKTKNTLSLQWLLKAYSVYPDTAKFFTPFFTTLMGTKKLEALVKQGKTEDEIRASWQEGLTAFKKIRKKYLLYPDFKE